ncbi:MAG: hypothetical protein AAFX78_12605 [Cyanobacteria bacterium J06638_20]
MHNPNNPANCKNLRQWRREKPNRFIDKTPVESGKVTEERSEWNGQETKRNLFRTLYRFSAENSIGSKERLVMPMPIQPPKF